MPSELSPLVFNCLVADMEDYMRKGRYEEGKSKIRRGESIFVGVCG